MYLCEFENGSCTYVWELWSCLGSLWLYGYLLCVCELCLWLKNHGGAPNESRASWLLSQFIAQLIISAAWSRDQLIAHLRKGAAWPSWPIDSTINFK